MNPSAFLQGYMSKEAERRIAFLQGYMSKEAGARTWIGAGLGGGAGLLAAHLYNKLRGKKGWKPYLVGGLGGAAVGGGVGALLEEKEDPYALKPRAGELKGDVLTDEEMEEGSPVELRPEKKLPPYDPRDKEEGVSKPYEPPPKPVGKTEETAPAPEAGAAPDWQPLIKSVQKLQADPETGKDSFLTAMDSTGVSVMDANASPERKAELEKKFFEHMLANPQDAADFLAWYKSLPRDKKTGMVKNPFSPINRVKHLFFRDVDQKLASM